MDHRDQTPSSPHESLDHTHDDDPAEGFAAVLACLNEPAILPLAKARKQLRYQTADDIDAVLGEVKYGSFHVLFPVEFSDGETWLVKIPKNGSADQWDELSAASLTSEANTMRMLKRETTVPIPAVIEFSSTVDNALHCPYIIISHIPGRSLYDVWFGHHLHGLDVKSVHSHRVRALEGIAAAMAQLSAYQFSMSGSPRFDAEGQVLSDVQPLRFLDNVAMLDRWLIHQDPSDDPIYIAIQPFSDPKHHFRFPLEIHGPRHEEPDPLVVVLRQLIEWLPEQELRPLVDKPFVLAHPDFDIQNFLVSDTGDLQAIIDWDGICAVPRSIGNMSFPGWLTRDWDSAMYGYVESMEEGEEPVGVWEDSPAELARYRGIYRDLMYDCLRQAKKPEHEANNVSVSLITENLAIAARDPVCRHGILEKMFGEIAKITEGRVQMDFLDLAVGMTDGDLGEEVLEALRRGFLEMVHKASSL